MAEDACEYIRLVYKVPARVGGKVIVDGVPGVIVNADHHIQVEFEDGHVAHCHPTWRVEYVDG